MKKLQVNAIRLTVIIVFGMFAVISLQAQCTDTPTDPCVPVHQSLLDRAAKAVDELKVAREAITALQKVTAASDAERAAYKNVIAVTESAIAIFQKGVADRDTVIALQQKALDMMAALNEKLMTQMGKGQSGWQKFVSVLKNVALILAGAALTRGL